MIKTLIKKEVRENLAVTLLGAAVFLLLIGLNFDKERLDQPLMKPGFHAAAAFFCGIFGALLGWLQMHRERHRDLWAFLIHRPMSRTGIFFGKVGGGMISYFVAAGLPIIGLTIYSQLPGRLASPFDWEMTLPALIHYLAGIACYFAGMVTGRRKARWYGSRGLALGAGLLISAGVHNFAEFWQALMLLAAGAIILGTAAWGACWSETDSHQPATAKIATPISLVPGAALVVVLATMLIGSLFFGGYWNAAGSPTTSYEVLKDGRVCIVTQTYGRVLEVSDTDHKPLADFKTQRTGGIDPAELGKSLAPGASVFTGHGPYRSTFWDASRFYLRFWAQLSFTYDSIWYFSPKLHRLLGYNPQTRRFIGSIGPEGLADTLNGPGKGFDAEQSAYYQQWEMGRTIATGSTVYEVDLRARSVKTFFTVEAGDRILGNSDIGDQIPVANNYPQQLATPTTAMAGQAWKYTLVVSERYVHLLTAEGRLVWREPNQPSPLNYEYAGVRFLSATNQYVLWREPSAAANEKAGGKLQIHVDYVGSAESTNQSLNLPVIPPVFVQPAPAQKIMSVLVPPVFNLAAIRPHLGLKHGAAIAVICALISLGLGRYYRVGAARQLAWLVFILLTGLGGFLVFLGIAERSAQEKCPNCGKRRVVDRERCEHCGAGFLPAEKNGTEIFEPLGTS